MLGFSLVDWFLFAYQVLRSSDGTVLVVGLLGRKVAFFNLIKFSEVGVVVLSTWNPRVSPCTHR